MVTRASKASWASSNASAFADRAFFSAEEQASTVASAMSAAKVINSSSLERSSISSSSSSTLVLNSEQVYVVVLNSISLLNLALSVSELDVVMEAAEDEEEVSCLIFSRTLSTFPETSATLSAVDGPSVVITVDPGVV